LARVAQVDRACDSVRRTHHPHQTLNEVVDVAERPTLAAVSINREWLAEQGGHHEVRHHPAVSRMHSRAVRVEQTDDFDAELMLAPVVEEECFCGSLALVVAGAYADRVDVTPIVLSLRVDLGVAVHLRR